MWGEPTGDTIFWDEPSNNLDHPTLPGNVVIKLGSGYDAEQEALMQRERALTTTGQECYETPRLRMYPGVSIRLKVAIAVLTIVCIAIVLGISQNW